MLDEGLIPDPGSTDNIVLLEVNGSFWMLYGEEHLNAMLTNMNPYPKPVHFIRFETEFDGLAILSSIIYELCVQSVCMHM